MSEKPVCRPRAEVGLRELGRWSGGGLYKLFTGEREERGLVCFALTSYGVFFFFCARCGT